jgi:serine/threonine-protein kinase HipA
VQEKLSLLLYKNVLRLTKENELWTNLFKPIPRDLKKVDLVPANKHLNRHIAKKVPGLSNAENALIFLWMVHLPASPNDLT